MNIRHFVIFSLCFLPIWTSVAGTAALVRPTEKLIRHALLLQKPNLTAEERQEIGDVQARIYPGRNTIPEITVPQNDPAMRGDAIKLPLPPSGPADPSKEEDPFFKELLGKIGPIYEQEGELALGKLLGFNAQFDLGQSNYTGISWQKPMGSFSFYVDRQMAPDAFSDNGWVVTDTMTLVVNAQSFLKLLSDQQLIEPLTDSELGAFAGLSYTRSYNFQHMANSFAEGLKAPLDRLFLPFLFARPEGMAKLPSPSMLTRIDSFVVSAGAYVYSPIFYGFSAKAGALFEYNHLSQLTLEKTDALSGVKLSYAKTNTLSAHVKAQVMADLYSVLQLTLFALDAQAQWSETQETSWFFPEQEVQEFAQKKGEDYDELKKVFHEKKFEMGTLLNNVLSHNLNIAGGSSLDVEALFWGHQGSKQVAQIELIKDGTSQFFVKSIQNKFDFFQKWWSKLLGDALKSILGTSFLGPNYFSYYKSGHTLDYKREKTKEDPEALPVESLSLTFNQSFYLAGSVGLFNQGAKKKFLSHMELYSGIDPELIKRIESDALVAPLTLTANLRIDEDGLAVFNTLNEEHYFEHLTKYCGTKREDFWLDKDKREQGFKNLQLGTKENCMKVLGLAYRTYQSERERLKNVPLKALRSWVEKASNYSNKIELILPFFARNDGKGALFAGTVQAAVGKNGPIYTTFFREGEISTRGIVNEALHLDGVPFPVNSN